MVLETKAVLEEINLERLKQNLLELSEIGRDPRDRGLYRMAFTDADMKGKQWFQEKLEAAGIAWRMDGAANLWGCLEGSDSDAAPVIVGSHLDTVPCAGALDGSLGVLIALECFQVLKENRFTPERPLEVVAFSDEEGRFGGMLGSQSVCGLTNPEVIHAQDLNGVELGAEMRKHGLDPLKILDASRTRESIHRYLELHIEQGPVLDRGGESIGIVEDIAGLFKWNVRLMGESNHAGTTPMEMRKDAFMGLADFAHEIPRILDENGSVRSRATIGKAEILPGAANTVAGRVDFSLDVRDTSPEVLQDLAGALRRTLSAIARRRDLKFEFDELSWIEPVRCDSELVKQIESNARELELSYLKMPSGAAHDAQIMANITPVGMIFVPSKNGISHSPAEWTDWADIHAGAKVLLRTLAQISKVKE